MTYTNGISDFDGKTISYTYDNGWEFTNTFEGNDRLSSVPRGELREIVEMIKLREGLYFCTWIDDEWGLLAQVIDFESNTVIAAAPADNGIQTQILSGKLNK